MRMVALCWPYLRHFSSRVQPDAEMSTAAGRVVLSVLGLGKSKVSTLRFVSDDADFLPLFCLTVVKRVPFESDRVPLAERLEVVIHDTSQRLPTITPRTNYCIG